MVRKMRKNAGAARGKYAAREGGVRVLPVKRKAYIGKMFEGYSPKRPVGRPRKMVDARPLVDTLLKILDRKKRSNAGTKRGPRFVTSMNKYFKRA